MAHARWCCSGDGLAVTLPDLLYQGQDASITLTVTGGVQLQAGDTVLAQLRRNLGGAVLAEVGPNGMNATVAGQTVTLQIPGELSARWNIKESTYTLYTTLLIIGTDGAHRLAVPLTLTWRASYTWVGA